MKTVLSVSTAVLLFSTTSAFAEEHKQAPVQAPDMLVPISATTTACNAADKRCDGEPAASKRRAALALMYLGLQGRCSRTGCGVKVATVGR